MAETCAVCGKVIGGVQGVNPAPEGKIQEAIAAGDSVPTPICVLCLYNKKYLEPVAKSCAVCGKQLGGLNGVNSAPDTATKEAREAGFTVPENVCMMCFQKIKQTGTVAAASPVGQVFCTSCGAAMSPQAKACPKCGHPNKAADSQKSWGVAVLLCLFLGGLGIHRFYVGKVGTGILQFLTLGGLGIWAFIDLIIILCGAFKDSNGNIVGETPGGAPRSKGVFVLAIVAAIVFYIGIASVVFKEADTPYIPDVSTTTGKSTPPTSTKKAEPETVGIMSAMELWNEYDANEVAAEAKYKGKTVAVDGVISSITTSIMGYPEVSFAVDEYGLATVTCQFPKKYSKEIAKLRKGQQLIVGGKVRIFVTGLMLTLDDCWLPKE